MRQGRLHFHGKNIHPGPKRKMINAVQLLKDFLSALPEDHAWRKLDGRQGFIHPMQLPSDRGSRPVRLNYSDHDRQAFPKLRKILSKALLIR